ncbi:MAG TPA: hypothetical protein VH105_06785, partial [Burkholderiales bacterium]|nr:hypothetical protein [Burkholderiales bacterium]
MTQFTDRLTPNTNPHDPNAQSINVLTEKWGWETMSMGFTAVPNSLLSAMGRMNASPMEMVVLIQLFRYWWHPGEW